ncbi:MAG: hypothetical protein ABQ298_15020 [Puniceicoccaceae bacterium]
MSKHEFSIISVRLLALAFCSTGVLWLIANVLETAWDFNPNYLGYYAATQLLHPALMVAGGIALHVFSRVIARLLSRE